MASQSIKAKFYEFSQNNSGGSFDINDDNGIGPRVWIQAHDADDANQRAIGIGIYFDGCSKEMDCPCCGDRWYEAHGSGVDSVVPNQEYDFNWHDTVYVHMMDGTIKRIRS